jgi:gliding motility-associated peptidyl-prolyl isomerase
MRTSYLITTLSILILSCGQPEARKPIVRKTSSFMSESIERNKLLTRAENELLLKKMEEDSSRVYLNSEYGFWYYYDRKGESDAPRPEKGDEVRFSYEILDLGGDVIFSKAETGTVDYRVDRQELISGLQDGIKLMREGEKVTFLFPSHKAYGYTGSDRINPNQPLIYKVELIQVNKLTENEKN